ncbi:MAG: SRPBCC domain-containing protein [Acidobacteriota bacterium]|nr:SRPBCC domain-containing protein [Acidobacteriota bacterium]
MSRVTSGQPSVAFDHSILIQATPERVLGAFFDPDALAAWWLAARSVTTPRPLGVYAVEWNPGREADAILGRLGGVFYGIVMEYKPGRELFVADAWWIPPDGEPVGPMSLQVNCSREDTACRLRIRQSGFEETPRFRRYYSVIERGWHISMAALKEYAEQ